VKVERGSLATPTRGDKAGYGTWRGGNDQRRPVQQRSVP
jgi:hypothetical protein